jgi:hypothetical protein
MIIVQGNSLGMSLAKRGLELWLEHRPHQEARMIKLAVRLATLAVFSMALAVASPVIPAFAAGGGGDPPSSTPPPDAKSNSSKSTHKTKKKANKQSSIRPRRRPTSSPASTLQHLRKGIARHMRRSTIATIMSVQSSN